MIKQGNATLAGETEARLFQVKDHPNCSSIIALNSLDLEIIQQNIFEGVTKYKNLMICRGRRRHTFLLEKYIFANNFQRCSVYSFESLFFCQLDPESDWSKH